MVADHDEDMVSSFPAKSYPSNDMTQYQKQNEKLRSSPKKVVYHQQLRVEDSAEDKKKLIEMNNIVRVLVDEVEEFELEAISIQNTLTNLEGTLTKSQNTVLKLQDSVLQSQKTLNQRRKRFSVSLERKRSENALQRRKAKKAAAASDQKHGANNSKKKSRNYMNVRVLGKESVTLKSDVAKAKNNIRNEVSRLEDTYSTKLFATE